MGSCVMNSTCSESVPCELPSGDEAAELTRLLSASGLLASHRGTPPTYSVRSGAPRITTRLPALAVLEMNVEASFFSGNVTEAKL